MTRRFQWLRRPQGRLLLVLLAEFGFWGCRGTAGQAAEHHQPDAAASKLSQQPTQQTAPSPDSLGAAAAPSAAAAGLSDADDYYGVYVNG